MRSSAIHAMQWRRRVVDFDDERRRPRWFVGLFVVWYVAFWIAVAFACMFELIGKDGLEEAEEPIRYFIDRTLLQTLRWSPLGVSTGVALVLTIVWWKFVSPGPRRNRATT